MNATMVNGWALFAAKAVTHGALFGINIFNKLTAEPARPADQLKMYSCFIRTRLQLPNSDYVDGDPNSGSMYLHGFNGFYYQRWAPVGRNVNAGEYVIDQVKSTRVLDSNSEGNTFLT